MKRFWIILLVLVLLLSGCAPTPSGACLQHEDADDNGICDVCFTSVYIIFDFYNINDLHGKLADADTHPGVDELTTYFRNAAKTDDHVVLLSTGDMWQGSSESNMTNGQIIVDWMNALDFAAMALGNHEFDWGEEYVAENSEHADFPFLAINVYDRTTDQRVDYCEASTVVEGGGLQIGIIGAIGDCYSSIAVDKCDEVYFKTGSALTALVKEESTRLRAQGVDFIVYLIHDGYGSSHNGTPKPVTGSQISSYYDTSLSDGYVDLVFEGHTHQGYRLLDEHGVYHLQNRGDNKGGIAHVEVAINSVTNSFVVHEAELVSTQQYQNLNDDPLIEQLLTKYADAISGANRVVGYNATRRSGDTMRQLVADLYYEAGIKKWGDRYDIVLGGGFISVRSPYNLAAGNVTYGDLQALFPFDNELILCSIQGRDLLSKFFETNNSNYFIDYGSYGAEVYSDLDLNATYYIVVDSYSAYYAPNRLTVVEKYGENLFARDLLAEYMEAGGLAK